MALTAGKFYRGVLAAHWLAYCLGLITLLLTSTTEVLIPKFIQWALDEVGPAAAQLPAIFARESRIQTLHLLTKTMLGALLIGWLGRFGWRQFLARRTHLTGRDLKVRLWDVLRFLPLKTFRRYPLGDLMNRATGDWNASRAIHGFTVVLTLDLIFFTVLSIASMLAIDWVLTLYCLAIFPFLPRIIWRIARRQHDLHVHAQEKLGELSDVVARATGTIRLQRATSSDATWQGSLREQAREYADRRFQVVKTGWRIFPLGALPTLIAYGILLSWGLKKIAAETLTVGEFIALQSYVLMLQGPLFDMGDCIAEWQRGFASLGRMIEIFNLQQLVDLQKAKKAWPQPAAGGIGFIASDLTFTYDDAPAPALTRLRLVAKPSERIGIFGPIGAGKTTLLSLLAGLIEAPPGMITIGGCDARKIDPAWFSQHVTTVPQRAFLFAGTVRYNLELAESYSESELWHALELAKLDNDIKCLAGGLEAHIGEWGVNLSGGQKQRLALARALLRRRQLLLLDDCLSAVDAVTEEAILRGLGTVLQSATVVWIAHRLSTLRLCDRVLYLERGVLREALTPQQVPL